MTTASFELIEVKAKSFHPETTHRCQGWHLVGHAGCRISNEFATDPIAAGIFSSLQRQNIRLRRAIENLESVMIDSRFPLLFDPQTAGGLVAAVRGDRAAACVTELKALGYPAAAIIGRVLPRSEQLAPLMILR